MVKLVSNPFSLMVNKMPMTYFVVGCIGEISLQKMERMTMFEGMLEMWMSGSSHG